MLNPWLRLLATHPHRLVEHAEAYAGLAACEARTASAAWARRALLYGVAAAGLVLTAMLGGVALMLCAVVAPAQMPVTELTTGNSSSAANTRRRRRPLSVTDSR